MVHWLAALTFLLAPAVASARTIAIAYFDNNTGDGQLDPLRKGLTDMLITDLANVGSLQIVERDKLNQVLGELELSQSKFIDPRTAQRLGKGLAAEFIMTGGYAVRGEGLRIDVRVGVLAGCRNLLWGIEISAKQDPAMRKRRWAERWKERWKNPTNEGEIALKLATPDILELFRLYGQKAKRP